MNPFKRDWNKPGPGVPKNAPKKKGPARFGEVLFREMGNLIKLNLLFSLLLVLPILLFLIGVYFLTQANWLVMCIFIVGSFAACLPLGPSLTAFMYLIAQMLRDEPIYVWHDFWRKYKENFKSTALPGLVFGLLFGSIGYMLLFGSAMIADMPSFVLALYFLALFLLLLSLPYFFLQAAYVTLSMRSLLQNSLLLSLGNLPRSLPGALMGSGLVLLQASFLPLTLPSLLFFGLSIPMLLNLLWVWPKIDSTFKIDETLKNRRDEEMQPS